MRWIPLWSAVAACVTCTISIVAGRAEEAAWQQDETAAIEEPLLLVIPRIRVVSKVEPVGLLENGHMDTPRAWDNVAWFAPGTRPGNPGSAVMAGHLDSTTGPAVFWKLRQLEPGDAVIVLDAQARILIFRVEKLRAYDEEAAPIDILFGPSASPRLNLLTCAGSWDHAKRGYDKRLAVYTVAGP